MEFKNCITRFDRAKYFAKRAKRIMSFLCHNFQKTINDKIAYVWYFVIQNSLTPVRKRLTPKRAKSHLHTLSSVVNICPRRDEYALYKRIRSSICLFNIRLITSSVWAQLSQNKINKSPSQIRRKLYYSLNANKLIVDLIIARILRIRVVDESMYFTYTRKVIIPLTDVVQNCKLIF